MYGLINIGFGNMVLGDRVIVIISNPESAVLKKLKDAAKESGKLIDARHGRKTRSILITDSNHVILSAIQPETLVTRFLQSFYEIEKTLARLRSEVSK